VRSIGLHLRLGSSLSDLLEKAKRLGSPIVQCFFITQSDNKYATFSEEEVEKCKALRPYFKEMYLHASYWVNLAGCRANGWRAFCREIAFAKAVGFTHIVIHPGSATGCESKEKGITSLARALNAILKVEHDIKIVLENTAHAGKTVGGSLKDFKVLLEQIEQPERIFFCIDTAHAHSYGYDIVDPVKQDIFLDEVDDIIGREKIALIHLNETNEECGSYIDRHAEFGKGVIGNEALQRFMNHPVCAAAPIILEIPVVQNEQEEKVLLEQVTSWNKK